MDKGFYSNMRLPNLGSTSTSTTAASPMCRKKVTIEDILHSAKLLKKFDRPTLYIWKGDSIFNLSERPQLINCKYLDEDDAYFVAGIGIASGKNAYFKILKMNIQLLWSDNYIDLEEQLLLFEGLELTNRKS